MTIYKYGILLLENTVTITPPCDAKILKVGFQNSTICMWFLVDPIAKHEDRKFHIFGTGFNIRNVEKLTYIDSVITDNGEFVWHIFEEKK